MSIKTLPERVRELATSCPSSLALCAGQQECTYAQLWDRTRAVAAALVARGIGTGDRVALVATSEADVVAAYLGIVYAGATVAFVDKGAKPAAKYRLCKAVDAALLVDPREQTDAAQNAATPQALIEAGAELDEPEPPACDPEDIAEIIFTTGTTGEPKGAMLSYRAVDAILHNTAAGIGITAEDTVLMPLPLSHSYALRVVRAALWQGATVVLQNGFVFARTLERNVLDRRCTGLALVPASLETLRQQMGDALYRILGELRYVEFGAGALSAAQRQELVAALPNTTIFNTWGSSETGGALFLNVSAEAGDPQAGTSAGHPRDGMELAFLATDGTRVVGDEANPGRLALRGPMVMSGYWGKEDLTAEALQDGWVLTNDLAWLDERGFVHLLGRADDIINVGGEKVAPVEVEEAASTFDGIMECACLGIDDPQGVYGQVPVLLVVPRPGRSIDEADLRKHLARQLDRFKVPQDVRFLDVLPRNRMRKLDRPKFAEAWENAAQSTDAFPSGEVLLRLIATRTSVRKFQDREVPRELLQGVVEAGLHAPTGHNLQTWRFFVLEGASLARLGEVVTELADAGLTHPYGYFNPQAAVLVCNDTRNATGCQDASCAAQNMLLAAHAQGLGAVWHNSLMGMRDQEPAKALLDQIGVPAKHEVWSCVLIGWPAETPRPPARRTNVIHYVD